MSPRSITRFQPNQPFGELERVCWIQEDFASQPFRSRTLEGLERRHAQGCSRRRSPRLSHDKLIPRHDRDNRDQPTLLRLPASTRLPLTEGPLRSAHRNEQPSSTIRSAPRQAKGRVVESMKTKVDWSRFWRAGRTMGGLLALWTGSMLVAGCPPERRQLRPLDLGPRDFALPEDEEPVLRDLSFPRTRRDDL